MVMTTGNRAPAKRVGSEPVADALGDRQRSSAGVPAHERMVETLTDFTSISRDYG